MESKVKRKRKIKKRLTKAHDTIRRIDDHMQQPVALPDFDHTHHKCTHCGYMFEGNYCPQCGLTAEHIRFNFKRLIHNFLDIWGLGNRPMFRTMRDLFWRPGYMIRDYLQGHHLSYFPPFKMLAVLTILIVFIAWIFNMQDSDVIADSVAEQLISLKNDLSKENSKKLLEIVANTIVYLSDNDLWRIIIQNIFLVVAVWTVFRKKGMNLVETFFSQVYINCQLHMVALVWMIVTLSLPPSEILPYSVPMTLSIPILVYDYMQLYGISLLKSIWKTILSIMLFFIIYPLFLLFIILLIGAFELI